MPDSYKFKDFLLDPANRQLTRDGAPVELNTRYLDALALLVQEPGQLISKERFLQEVWRGVPVTDEALTQCIRTLRRQLGDDASKPHFIETVPKHGYRFIAPVSRLGSGAASALLAPPPFEDAPGAYSWREFFQMGAAGTIGGGVAGMFGGLFYSFAGATRASGSGMGEISVLLVLVCLTALVGLLGGAGVAFGLAAAGFAHERKPLWTIAGAAGGGLVVGALVKLIGVDALNLLFGQSPGNVTGGPEGALLGGAVGVAVALSARKWKSRSLRNHIALAAPLGLAAGVLIGALGGRLMAGSLHLFASRFTASRIQLDQIGSLFGESKFGPVSQIVTGGIEGLLFAVCVVGAMKLAAPHPKEAGPRTAVALDNS